MLRIYLAVLVFFTAVSCFAQETLLTTQTTSQGLTEKYSVLKSNTSIKQGLYQAFYKRKTIVASGSYNNGKRIGIWHFYGPDGKLLEHFNYNTNELLYEAPRDSSTSIQYDMPDRSKDSVIVSRPVRIGGLYYGYLPYIKQFKLAQDVPVNYAHAVLQILVSPAGRLAECKLLIKTKLTKKTIDAYVLNEDLLNEDEKIFVPASVEHQNVPATIYINCTINNNNTVSIY